MKFLADENIARDIVLSLQKDGHDVKWIAQESPGISDNGVLQCATKEERIIVTSDRDFGDMIFRDKKPHRGPGIILFRLKKEDVERYITFLKVVLKKYRLSLQNNFIIVSDKKIRLRKFF